MVVSVLVVCTVAYKICWYWLRSGVCKVFRDWRWVFMVISGYLRQCMVIRDCTLLLVFSHGYYNISDKNGQDTIEQCKGQVTSSLRGYSYTFSFLKLQSAVSTKILFHFCLLLCHTNTILITMQNH